MLSSPAAAMFGCAPELDVARFLRAERLVEWPIANYKLRLHDSFLSAAHGAYLAPNECSQLSFSITIDLGVRLRRPWSILRQIAGDIVSH